MAATLTSVVVAGTSVTVKQNMTQVLEAGTTMPVKVVFTVDSGDITVGGKAIAPDTPIKVNFNNSPVVNITVKDGDVVNKYTLAVSVAADNVQDVKVKTIRNVGWFAARYIEGDLDTYTAGGIMVPMGNFAPKYVISVQITGGFIGYFDAAQKKLMVYASSGTEATASALAKEHYQLVLME